MQWYRIKPGALTNVQVMAKVTFRQWCESRGFSHSSATKWRHTHRPEAGGDFPEPVERISLTYLYDDRHLDRWKKAHPELGLGRHKRAPDPS